jgi:chitinase
MKIKLCILIPFFVFLLSATKAQPLNDSAFKIVGYYSLKSAMTDFKNVPFSKLTHINLYFLNPDSTGNFKQNFPALVPFIKAAHAEHVKVLASVAGGGRHPYYAKLLKDTDRVILINKLLSIVLLYDLDGIDVDIEGSDIDENYDNFVIELAASLHEHKKLITAAIAVFFKGDYTDKALAQFDFVNIMSYDHTGSWAPAKPGPHSTYAQAVEDLSYFKVIRGIPKEKLILGVPFYGYGFGPTLTTPGISRNYGEIVSEFPGAEFSDQLNTGPGRIMYYNGVPTIKMKTALAKAEASGIMIWQLSGDAPGSKSLLQAIKEAVKETK